jgi:hypothetical protein
MEYWRIGEHKAYGERLTEVRNSLDFWFGRL